MRIYKIGVTVDVGDDFDDKQVEEWVQDALGPAARAISVQLRGRVASKADCEDLLFSFPVQRVTLKDGDVLIFRFKEHMTEKHAKELTDRVLEVFGDKCKALILEGGVDMVVGEIVEKEGAGG